jgi:hypothetical protein
VLSQYCQVVVVWDLAVCPETPQGLPNQTGVVPPHLCCCKQLPLELVHDSEGSLHLLKPGSRVLEVTWIGQPVGTCSTYTGKESTLQQTGLTSGVSLPGCFMRHPYAAAAAAAT